jgi:F-type H+-transporting ATPase subunit delta
MLSALATRYAKALADVVTAPGSRLDPAQVQAQLQQVRDLLHASPELKGVLATPAVPPSRKRSVMAKVLAPLGISPQVRNFVYIVIDHRRIHEFSSMIEAFERLIDERTGVVRADVTSARELNGAQQAALQERLSRLSGRRARLQFSTDPALIAGVVARVGSTVYDGSVRGRLERLRLKLGSH